MNRQVVKLADGLTLLASDIIAALGEEGVVAVVVYKEGAKPLATTDVEDILFIATAPKTAEDLYPARVLYELSDNWIDSVPDGLTETAATIAQLLLYEEGSMKSLMVVLFKGEVKPLSTAEPEDILFIAQYPDQGTLQMLRAAEETDTQTEERTRRLLAGVAAWSPDSGEGTPPWLA